MPAFGRESRILVSRDFDRVMRQGRRVHSRNLILFLAKGEGEGPRLGLAVSRKVGVAVCRNRWKRLLRAAFRLSLKDRLHPVDLVVVVKSAPVPEGAPRSQGAARPHVDRTRRIAPGLAAVERELRDALLRLEALDGPGGSAPR